MTDSGTLEFRLLGPLEVRADAGTLSLGSPKQRALLALLLLHANEPVSRERLIDELWGEAAPATVNSAFHVYLSRLRKLLGDRLERNANGYLLRVELDELDSTRFQQLALESREAEDAADPARAAELLREALALWRGPPLADLEEPFAAAAAARFEEMRLAALEDRMDVELELGRHRSVVAELESLVAEHPFRERFRAQLMLALYRSERQADALEAYQRARRTFADDLGLEPGPELKELEQAILRHDSQLAAPTRTGAPQVVRRRSLYLVVALVVVAAVALVSALALTGRRSSTVPVPVNSLAEIDAGSNRVVGSTPVGVGPSQVAVGADSVWVLNVEDRTVSRIDPESRALQKTIQLPSTPTGLAFGGGAVWVANGPAGTLSKIDPALNRVVRTRRVTSNHGQFGVVAYGSGSVWAVYSDSTLRRIDPRWPWQVRRIAIVGFAPAGLAVGDGSVWVANAADNTLSRVLIDTASVALFTTGRHPSAVAVGADAVWVANSGDDAVLRLDPSSGSQKTIPVGRDPSDVTVGARSVWVANAMDGTVSRIDPTGRRPVKTIRVGNRPNGLTVVGDRVWVSVGAPT